MYKSGEVISQLLSYYLWDDESRIDKTLFDSLSAADWNEVHRLSLRQGVSAMVLDAAVKAGIAIPRTIKMLFITSTDQIERKYQHKVATATKLSKILWQHDIELMILKGIGLAQLYPTPNHRPCSDIDIWLFGKQEEADNILRTKYNIAVNEGHHHHTVFYIDNVMFENHYDFVEQHSRNSKKYIEQHIKELSTKELPIKQQVDDFAFYIPAPNHCALFLLMHSGAHFAAETIPVRHLTDWAMFLKHYGDKVDWQSIIELGNKFGFIRFLECLNAMCISYLGMPKELACCYSTDCRLTKRALLDVLEYRRVNIPDNFIKGWIFKFKRRFANSWKQKMVYNDSQLTAFVRSALTHIIHPNLWKK